MLPLCISLMYREAPRPKFHADKFEMQNNFLWLTLANFNFTCFNKNYEVFKSMGLAVH